MERQLDPNALDILQQLSNPEVYNQIQSVLQNIKSNPVAHGRPQDHRHHHNHSSTHSNDTSHSSIASPPISLVPRRGARQDPSAVRSATATSGRPSSHHNSHRYRDAQGIDEPTPSVSFTEFEKLQAKLREAEGQRRDQQRTAAEALSRAERAEKETLRLQQRVEELQLAVQEQRQGLLDVEQRRCLEVEELQHTFESVLRRKEEVHEESVRQLMKSRQLLSASKQFELSARRQEGLHNATAAMNVIREVDANHQRSVMKPAKKAVSTATQHTASTPVTDGMKRARDDDTTEDDYIDNQKLFTSTQTRRLTRLTQQSKGVSDDSSARPLTKSSTLLTRTISRKRRTPRTPSLTHADRVHSSSRSPAPPALTSSSSYNNRALLPAAAAAHSPTPTMLSAAVGSDARQYQQKKQAAARSETISPGGPAVTRFVSQYQPGLPVAPVGTLNSRLKPQPQQRAVPGVRSGTSSIAPGPTRSPSPVDPKRGPVVARRFIFTGLKDAEPEELRAAIESIGEDAEAIAGELDEPPPFSATHIVLRGTPRSVKALCGVVSGKWLVPPEYVYHSQEAGFWLDEFEEGGLRIFPPPLKCQRFLLTVDHAGIREKLAQVIEYGGGEVVKTSSASSAGRPWTEQGVVVITSGDDLLRHATQQQQH